MASLSSQTKPQLATGQDASLIHSKLSPLLEKQEGAERHVWEIVQHGKGIRREFRFKTFNNTWVSEPPCFVIYAFVRSFIYATYVPTHLDRNVLSLASVSINLKSKFLTVHLTFIY